MRNKFSISGIGVVSLLLLFAVLSLSVFVLLTLSTAQSEQTLCRKAAQAVSDYYQADSQATVVLAGLLQQNKTGTLQSFTYQEIPISVTETSDGQSATYRCPVDAGQVLTVCVQITSDTYQITQWQVEDISSWQNDDRIPVWDGE